MAAVWMTDSFIEWYRDDDGDSGYGDSAEVQRWYGWCDDEMTTRERLVARAKLPPPEDGWRRVDAGMFDSPPHDAATATGMYDRW